DAFDADMLGIDCRIGLKIIEAAIRAPCPCAQRAPVVGLARLAFVHKADDAAREAIGVIGLHTGRIEADKAPAGSYQLPFIRRIAISVHLWNHEERRFLQWLPCGAPGKDVLERRILLDE